MNPHYIIDGYNVIHSLEKFRNALSAGLEQARNELISLIRSYRSGKMVKVTVVFDGDEVGYIDGSRYTGQSLQVIYSKFPEKADPVIKRLIQKNRNKKAVVLVSADNALVQFARQVKAQVLSPNEFYQRATKHPSQDQVEQKFDSQLSEKEVSEWLKLFKEGNR
ncbi:MAG TPA: NYN domain-containing protein [bacterium]